MNRNVAAIDRDLKAIRQQFQVDAAPPYDRIVIRRFPLPRSWRPTESDLLLVMPSDYPLNQPSLFVQNHCRIRFRSRDAYGGFHSFDRKHALWKEGWAWVCFWNAGEEKGGVPWDPVRDSLVTYLQKAIDTMASAGADREEHEF